MLLILSDDTDSTTDHVIHWLKYNNCEFIRINYSNKITINTINVNDDVVDLEIELIHNNGKSIRLKEITAYWYRRGHLNIYPHENLKNPTSELEAKLFQYLKDENDTIRQYIYHYLSSIKHVGDFNENDLNKLVVLDLASKLGFKTPQTIVTSKKDTLVEFSSEYDLITKGLFLNGIVSPYKYNVTCGTNIVKKDEILTCNDQFFTSLFQNRIEKLFELRIFYFEKKIFATVILSQQNPKTKIDFRNYDLFNPNRMLPYKLPKEIKMKIIRLMKKLKMKSGSLDMIVNKDGDYIFLEINPVGQFGNISVLCNFYIEKYIAEYFNYEKN